MILAKIHVKVFARIFQEYQGCDKNLTRIFKKKNSQQDFIRSYRVMAGSLQGPKVSIFENL